MQKLEKSKLILLIVVIILFSGCATTPSVQIWQPWTRILDSKQSIPLNSKIQIKVEGETKPLLGNDILLQKDIKNIMKYLLRRRGYKIGDDNYQFLVKVRYKTIRQDKIKSSFSTYSSSIFKSGSIATSGLGVSIAQTVGALSYKSSTASKNVSKSVKLYNHTVSIEIFNKNHEVIWKSESTWDSPNINLKTDIKPSIQIMISNLPKDKKYIPTVSKVKNGKENNYYNLICKDKWFSCPALPYKITFEYNSSSSQSISDFSLPRSINNPPALAAYIDLLQTAEYVLPLGKKNYDNPLDNSLWSKIQLGGLYKYTNGRKIKVLIKLIGVKEGYYVDECWIATDEEFKDFENKLADWRNALFEYYDIYEE